MLLFSWCVGNGTPSTAKKITAFAVIFVVRPQGLVGSPKASVIESEAKDLHKANVYAKQIVLAHSVHCTDTLCLFVCYVHFARQRQM